MKNLWFYKIVLRLYGTASGIAYWWLPGKSKRDAKPTANDAKCAPRASCSCSTKAKQATAHKGDENKI